MPNIISHLIEKVIEIIADILLPKNETVKQLEALGPKGLLEKIPQANDFNFKTDSLKAVFDYKNNLCRQAIWEIKFRMNKKLIRDFSLVLYDFILQETEDLYTFNYFKKIILIPIPSSKARKREKGFNQCLLICQELIKIDRERNQNTFTLVENLLVKEINTSRQTKTNNKKERLENLKGSFAVKDTYPKNNLKDFSFILIDDVITTGATMNEGIQTLRKAGARKIIGLALAH